MSTELQAKLCPYCGKEIDPHFDYLFLEHFWHYVCLAKLTSLKKKPPQVQCGGSTGGRRGVNPRIFREGSD